MCRGRRHRAIESSSIGVVWPLFDQFSIDVMGRTYRAECHVWGTRRQICHSRLALEKVILMMAGGRELKGSGEREREGKEREGRTCERGVDWMGGGC